MSSLKNRNLLYCSVMEAMEELQDIPNRPQSIYFEKQVESFHKPEREFPKQAIGTYCVMIPEELIYSAGATPVRLCAESHEAASLGEEILPRTSCSMVKSIAGIAHGKMSGMFDSCKAVVVPTTCDWKKKLGEILGDYTDVWTMEVPHIKNNESSRKHWYEEIVSFKKKLENLTGNKITRKKLIAAIKNIQQAQMEFRRFYKLRMNNPPLISGRDALLVMQSYFYDEPTKWAHNLKILNNELEQKLSNKDYVCSEETPRILLTGSPILFPNWKVPNLVESFGGIIVTDEFCTSNRYIYDLVALDELSMSELLMAVAERYLLPCTCPCFTPNDDRMKKILQMIEDFEVDGVVYHILSGCHLYEMEAYKFEKKLREINTPFLKIVTDYGPEDSGQLRVRIEAFMESISARNGRMCNVS